MCSTLISKLPEKHQSTLLDHFATQSNVTVYFLDVSEVMSNFNNMLIFPAEKTKKHNKAVLFTEGETLFGHLNTECAIPFYIRSRVVRSTEWELKPVHRVVKQWYDIMEPIMREYKVILIHCSINKVCAQMKFQTEEGHEIERDFDYSDYGLLYEHWNCLMESLRYEFPNYPKAFARLTMTGFVVRFKD